MAGRKESRWILLTEGHMYPGFTPEIHKVDIDANLRKSCTTKTPP